MTQEVLSVPGEIKKVETLVDKSLKLVLYTQELDPEDISTLFRLKGKLGWFLFKESNIVESDIASIPEEVKEFKTDRTPSQRLRAVIYRVWEQSGGKETFMEFYGRHIDVLCDQYKQQLN